MVSIAALPSTKHEQYTYCAKYDDPKVSGFTIPYNFYANHDAKSVNNALKSNSKIKNKCDRTKNKFQQVSNFTRYSLKLLHKLKTAVQ